MSVIDVLYDLRDTSISLCGVACALLGSRQDKLKLLRVVDGIEHWQDRTAGVAKDVLHVVSQHHLVKDLTSGHAHKRVVMLWLGLLRLALQGLKWSSC